MWVREFGHVTEDETGALMVQGFMVDMTERQLATDGSEEIAASNCARYPPGFKRRGRRSGRISRGRFTMNLGER